MALNKSVDLSKHETDVLLGLYSGCECLWNTKNPDYKDKKIRIGAIRTIINGMRLETGKDYSRKGKGFMPEHPDFVWNSSQMQTALDNICKKYSQELQQVMEAENAPGNGYKSQWRWFQFLDSFLRDNVLHAQKVGMETESGRHDGGDLNVEEDGNDTDDYYCATVDSGDEDHQPSPSKGRAQMQVLPSRSSATSSSARPSRTSSRRVDVNALLNGSSYSAGLGSTDTHSSRKRRREAAASPASSSRSSLTSAAGASRNSSSYSRHSGSSGTPHTWSSKTVGGGQSSAELSQHSQSESLRISSQIADTLKAVQILLATSLTDQDQPSMVFARHIANELQQISDYGQRKQCMLEVQQVILRHQTKQQPTEAAAQIKFEGRGEHADAMNSGSRASTTATQQQCAEEPLLLYFDTP